MKRRDENQKLTEQRLQAAAAVLGATIAQMSGTRRRFLVFWFFCSLEVLAHPFNDIS